MAGSNAAPVSNADGAGARISVPGDISGRQNAGSRPAGTSGSWTKPQPPAAGQTGTGAARVGPAARDLAERANVIAAITCVAAQELDGETGAVEAVQLFNRVR
jgi:hypothetical protein